MPVMANVAKYLGFKEIADSKNILLSGILNRTGNRLMKAASPKLQDLGDIFETISNIIPPLGGPGFTGLGSFGKYGKAAWGNMAKNWWGGANGWQRAARVGALAGAGYATYKGARFVNDGKRPLWKRAGVVGAVGVGAQLLSLL
jgi:hypothetical protein